MCAIVTFRTAPHVPHARWTLDMRQYLNNLVFSSHLPPGCGSVWRSASKALLKCGVRKGAGHHPHEQQWGCSAAAAGSHLHIQSWRLGGEKASGTVGAWLPSCMRCVHYYCIWVKSGKLWFNIIYCLFLLSFNNFFPFRLDINLASLFCWEVSTQHIASASAYALKFYGSSVKAVTMAT